MSISPWHPIRTAPRDGTPVILTAFDEQGRQDSPEYHMYYDRKGKNALFPGVVGMWVAVGGGFTWAEIEDNFGPTHWRHVS